MYNVTLTQQFAVDCRDEVIRCFPILYHLGQVCGNSIADALELQRSCVEPSIYGNAPSSLMGTCYILNF